VKTCIIFNPTARGEKASQFRSFLEDIAGQAACKPTTGPGAATELARDAVSEGFENIVAAGGDGTVNEVLNGLATAKDGLRKCRFGILPLGTINVFAKELNIPEQAEAAWQTILDGNERTVDLPYAEQQIEGKTERRYFAQLAGAGLDAEAISLVDWESKKRFRQFAYIYAGLRAFFRPQHQIEAKGAEHDEKGELVLIGNGKFYGGRLPVFPTASLEDGRFDVCVFPKISLFTVTRFVFWLCLGRLWAPHSPMKYFQTDRLSLTSTTGAKFEVEGDLAGPLPAEIGIRARALRVICP